MGNNNITQVDIDNAEAAYKATLAELGRIVVANVECNLDAGFALDAQIAKVLETRSNWYAMLDM